MVAQPVRVDKTALGAHLGFKKRIERRARLGASRNHKQATLEDWDLCLASDLEPDLKRSHGAPPAFPRLLAGDRDEAEIAHRGPIGLRVAIDDDDPFAASGAEQRVRKPANAGADDREIISRRVWAQGAMTTARGRRRPAYRSRRALSTRAIACRSEGPRRGLGFPLRRAASRAGSAARGRARRSRARRRWRPRR